MLKVEDYIGKVYNYLTILSFEGINNNGKRIIKAVCKCGNIKYYGFNKVKAGSTKSCGCFRRENSRKIHTTHGIVYHSLYRVWRSMIQRCYNKNCKAYKYYGARGIIMHSSWRNDCKEFYNWAIEHGWQKGLELDRKENNGNYEPDNCRFITKTINAGNKRTNKRIEYNGEIKILSEWCKLLNLDYKTTNVRLLRNWDIKDAFEKPINIQHRNKNNLVSAV